MDLKYDIREVCLECIRLQMAGRETMLYHKIVNGELLTLNTKREGHDYTFTIRNENHVKFTFDNFESAAKVWIDFLRNKK